MTLDNQKKCWYIILTHLVNPLTDFGLEMVINDRIETSHYFFNQVTDFYNNDQLKLTYQKSVIKPQDHQDVFVANHHCWAVCINKKSRYHFKWVYKYKCNSVRHILDYFIQLWYCIFLKCGCQRCYILYDTLMSVWRDYLRNLRETSNGESHFIKWSTKISQSFWGTYCIIYMC